MKDSAFYNPEFKKQFLETLESTSLFPVYTALFNKSASVEERLGKDVYDFNSSDIELFFYTVSTPSVQSLRVYLSLLIRYVDYASKTGQRLSNINLFRNVRTEVLDQYVAYYKHSHITLEEFNEFMDYLANDFDVAIFRALFEGINGTGYAELTNLKMSDIFEKDNKIYVTLYDTDIKTKEEISRVKEISPQLFRDLRRADAQQEYISGNGEGTSYNSFTEFAESPYIFKPLKKGNYTQSSGQIDKQTIYRKSAMLSELTDGKITNVRTLVTSGMLHKANEIYKENGELTGQDLLNIASEYRRGSKSQHIGQQISRVKTMLRNGLKERYNIEI